MNAEAEAGTGAPGCPPGAFPLSHISCFSTGIKIKVSSHSQKNGSFKPLEDSVNTNLLYYQLRFMTINFCHRIAEELKEDIFNKTLIVS